MEETAAEEPGDKVDFDALERMSLEELLYYVLVGDGRRRQAVKNPA
jgi:hypothetical protein